ncbi:MAG TPA: CehA/McbA family metallohydrolase, partial [Kofleriaceae bacterium]|nr:CehA/McbA family metallohydrolase [Kofleriaceae bacterium]
RVHATGADGGYLTRAPVDAGGRFLLRVPAAGAVTLTAVTSTGVVATSDVADGATTATIALPPLADLVIDHVVDDAGATIPARVQVLPLEGGPPIAAIPDSFGEAKPPDGRHVVHFHDGSPMRLPLLRGRYHVIVSRGPEYELYERDVDLSSGEPVTLAPMLEHVVDTTGVQCGDFHIHTIRSNDAQDDAVYKVQSAMSDGVEIMLRSDHEWVGDFQPLIEQHGWDRWVMGVGSIEMTSFEVWGHMGVFPVTADASQVNAGAPAWQTFPSAASPGGDVVTLNPVDVFNAVRARPEHPTIIINHPQGATNYFGYVGLDPATGLVGQPQYWDDKFNLVEVFNNSGWDQNRPGTIASWFALLNSGRHVFAVGSSDSHTVRTSPVGYPRTCVRLGKDDPREIDGDAIRDQLVLGHATVSGGIYVDTAVGQAGPGDLATGLGAQATVDVRVQAASWVDVDTVEVIVDGETVATIPVTDDDADPMNPAVRLHRSIPVDVASGGSWVVVAATGGDDLSPVHPGKATFGVANPIFLSR